MRATAMVAGAALMVAACGGKKDAASSAGANTPAAAATTGTTHDIQMVAEGASSFKFVPENTTIKSGDIVVFKSVSGITHDVAFIADSIPPGASAVLTAAMKGGPMDMATDMIPEGQSVSVSFAGAPAGVYHMYCIPHAPMGMRGSITVQ
jgi:plastocyanin